MDDYSKARLLAAASKHSADWLHAIPNIMWATLWRDAVRNAVGLRMGADICQPRTYCCSNNITVQQ